MDNTEEQRRWGTAQELYHAADTVFHQQCYKACAGLAYYACFQAMWVALGDPPTGEWRHVGITRRFCHGQWATPPLLPSSLGTLHKRLLALYELRLDAHYRAREISLQQAQQGLEAVVEVLHLVQAHKIQRL
ncbi:MAG: hypothetical protein HOP18_10375 [Deltaproteobacteria bacterium]|nr:hypothetical protein [Deltaproteobacteria bacterium]